MRYGREELERILALRRARGATEAQGADAFIEGRIKVTPELLAGVLGGHWVATDGSKAELVAVSIDSDGLFYPEFATKVPAE